MLAGDQARRFAIECGFEVRNLMTEANCKRYEEWRKSPDTRKGSSTRSGITATP